MLLVFAACQPATMELTDAEKATIVDEVNPIKADFWDAWRAWDVDRGMSYYRNSPDFVWADDGELVQGWTTFNEAVQSWNVESQAVTLSESIATVLAPNVVQFVEHGTYSITDTTGVTWPERTFAVSTLWVLRNGEWKVDFIHISRVRSEVQ
jgi:hypothetical protein